MTDRESPKHRFSQKTADFRRFTPSPGNSSICRAQETAENRRFSQETADFRRRPAGNRRLGSVTLGPSPLARPYEGNPLKHRLMLLWGLRFPLLSHMCFPLTQKRPFIHNSVCSPNFGRVCSQFWLIVRNSV